MKLLRLELNRISTIAIFAIITSLAMGTFVYAGSYNDDNNKTYGDNSSSVFSPGYLNVAKYKTESIVSQATPRTGLIENIVNTALGKTSNNIKEDAVVIKFNQPELKKKASAASSGTKAQASATTVNLADVKIGTGTDKVYDGGRLISEVIDGKRNIYAGFDNVGTATIKEAVALATAGDKVIVKGGTYALNTAFSVDPTWNTIYYMKNGVSLYGGYGEDGAYSSLNKSLIQGSGYIYGNNMTSATEISGFTYETKGAGGLMEFRITSSSSVTFTGNTFDRVLVGTTGSPVTATNNTFKGYFSGLSIYGPSGVVKNNTFDGCLVGLTVMYATVLVESNTFSSSADPLNSGYDMQAWTNSNITSKNNNFSGPTALIFAQTGNVTSTGDYYANGVAPSSGFTISNQAINPNTITPASTTVVTQASPLALASEPLTIDTDARFGDTGSDSYKFATGDLGGASPLGTVLKNLLANNGNLGGAGGLNNMMPDKVSANPMAASALSLPLSINPNQRVQDMEAAMKLANILKNPTEDQKLILDAVQALIKDMDNTAVAQNNKELQAEADKLIDMAASYLLNQALPDLIKAGDMAGVKNIFQDLNTSKSKIMLEYQTATTPYYSEVKKMLQENAEGLQAKGMLSKTITQEQLEKLPPKEISRILDMIRKDPNRTFGEDYILQQESKLSKKYIEPNKKILEEQMKAMLKEFTKRLSAALEAKEK